MDFLGIGPLELVFILIIALIVLGPNDMVKAGRTIGRTLRMIISSDTWRVVQDASREIRNLPNRMMREAALDDLQKQLPNQSTIKSQLGLDELDKALKSDLSGIPSGIPSSSTGSKPDAGTGGTPGSAPSGDISSWTTPPPTIGKPEHMQAAVPQPEQSAEGAGSWSEPYNSGSETASDKPPEAGPPAEAELPPDPDQPASADQQPAVESPVQAEESPASDRSQLAGEEPHPDEMQPGSE